LPGAQPVVPAPDGGYPGGNTAEGQNALFSLTTGGYNTAVGFFSLRSDTTGSFNTALGAGTLFASTGDQNTATGAGALLSNTIGEANTANGASALLSNTTGGGNTATGYQALLSNQGGLYNTAVGSLALLGNISAAQNTAVGRRALQNSTGYNNTALGYQAGVNLTTGSGNVYIGVVPGVAGESNSCYIASIFDQTSASGIPVLINSDNKLGTTTSSARFKEEIKPMNQASEALFALKPVTFRYKDIHPARIQQFGLVAEEVEKVNPDLVVRDKEGTAYSVRYDQVNAMLLNEFLKEHRKVEEQQATITELKATVTQQQKDFQATAARQQKQIEALTAGLQKVSAQVEMGRPAPRVVVKNQ
jgi:trimeric autotransporter adhesin